jgi:hypothetical protein
MKRSIKQSQQRKNNMSKSKLRIAFMSITLGGVVAVASPARADLLLDRGLPTANLNNAAGADRSNVSWAFTQYTSDNYWLVGDTFKNTSSQTWTINSIRLWTVGQTDTAILRGGIDGSTIGVISGATYASAAPNDLYQGSSGSYIAMHQVDFAVNITLAAGQTYDFFLDGSGSQVGIVVPFVHSSNAALSGSPQDGADNSMLYANVISGIVDAGSIGTWSSLGDGWDKASDVNVQVFGAVPEPTTLLAGALLLLPFGASGLRMLRKHRAG